MGFAFTRFSPDEKASREYDLHTGSDHFATYPLPRRCFLCPVAVSFSPQVACARNPKIHFRSFSLLVNHAYLEIIEGNEIKFLEWIELQGDIIKSHSATH